MAMIKCPECSTVISDKAPTCPHCGAKRRSTYTSFATWAGVILIVLIVMIMNGHIRP